MNRYDQMVNRYLGKNKARSAFTIAGVVIVTAFLFVCIQIILNLVDLGDLWSEDSTGSNRFGLYFFALLIYINTVVVVGIIKQSIMISSLDQIKNYGILRLLGATKNQIAFLIFKATCLLEMIGAFIGFGVGFVIYSFVRKVLVIDDQLLPLNFRWEVVVYILLVLLFDAFFSVRENVKLINQMTPLEAYRGTFRIQKEKQIKHTPFLFNVFGIEGQYAYKNVRRNPGRFFRTLCAVTFGMAAVIGITGCVSIIKNSLKVESSKYGYYGIYAYRTCFSYEDKTLYKEIFQNVKLSNGKIEGHSNGKPVYGSRISMTDPFFVMDSVKDFDHFKYDNTIAGLLLQLKDTSKTIHEIDSDKSFEDLTDTEQRDFLYQGILADATILGFDEEDFKREESMLISGTTNLSENGILFVAGFNYYEESVYHYGFNISENVIASDHKVGDQVTFFDPQTLYERFISMKEQYMDPNKDYNFLFDYWILEKAKEELLQEGKVKTYTIEGILCRDANCDMGLGFILPLDQYLAFTGQNKEDFNGVMFHPTTDIKNINDMVGLYDYLKCDKKIFSDGILIATSEYDPEIGSLLKMSYYGIAYAMIIYVLNCINILNASITNLQLRRSEFAQLKVLGTSQGGLRKMVLLESFIISLFSALGSVVLGLLLEWFLYDNIFRIMMPSKFMIPFEVIVTFFFVNLIFMCICTYMPLKKRNVDLAEYLYENEE